MGRPPPRAWMVCLGTCMKISATPALFTRRKRGQAKVSTERPSSLCDTAALGTLEEITYLLHHPQLLAAPLFSISSTTTTSSASSRTWCLLWTSDTLCGYSRLIFSIPGSNPPPTPSYCDLRPATCATQSITNFSPTSEAHANHGRSRRRLPRRRTQRSPQKPPLHVRSPF